MKRNNLKKDSSEQEKSEKEQIRNNLKKDNSGKEHSENKEEENKQL